MTALDDANPPIEALIAELRAADYGHPWDEDLPGRAADRLAALLEENERLRGELDQVRAHRNNAIQQEDRQHARAEVAEAKLAEAWWEGVNDQWKHRPIGLRVPEFANPYRDVPDTRSEDS